MAAKKLTVKRARTPAGGVLYVVDYGGRKSYFDNKSEAAAHMRRLWKEEKLLRQSGLRPNAGHHRKRKRSTANPTVYDSAGKLIGKFSRKAAKLVARAVDGTVGKPKKMNPIPKGKALAFRTRAAAQKWARSHGLKRYSIRKAPR